MLVKRKEFLLLQEKVKTLEAQIKDMTNHNSAVQFDFENKKNILQLQNAQSQKRIYDLEAKIGEFEEIIKKQENELHKVKNENAILMEYKNNMTNNISEQLSTIKEYFLSLQVNNSKGAETFNDFIKERYHLGYTKEIITTIEKLETLYLNLELIEIFDEFYRVNEDNKKNEHIFAFIKLISILGYSDFNEMIAKYEQNNLRINELKQIMRSHGIGELWLEKHRLIDKKSNYTLNPHQKLMSYFVLELEQLIYRQKLINCFVMELQQLIRSER